MSEEKPLAEVIELLRKERAGMLTTLSDEVLVSRPTNVLDVDDDLPFEYKGAMPPRGGAMDATDEEITKAVEFMMK